jgi:hypothetical protein
MRKITLLQQPTGSNLCGQYCVAMLADVTPAEAIKSIGKRGRTSTRDLVRGLRKLGYACADQAERIGRAETVPSFGIIKLTIDRGPGARPQCGRHWILVYNGVSYDPAGRAWDSYIGDGWKATSYLPIEI